MVESSGLLNRRRVISSTGGSNPPLSAINLSYNQAGDRDAFSLRVGGLVEVLAMLQSWH